MQQRLMAAQQQSDLKQQQAPKKQQQMQQGLKATHQQTHLEQLKREEEAAVAQACLEAMSDALCWGTFDNILAAG